MNHLASLRMTSRGKLVNVRAGETGDEAYTDGAPKLKALFVHDHRFVETPDGIFSNQITYSFLGRYLSVFEEVTVIGRRAHGSSPGTEQGLGRSSGPSVNFHLVDSTSMNVPLFGQSSATRDLLRQAVGTHDMIIARLPSELGLLAAAEARRIGKDYALEVVGCYWDALWNKGGLVPRLAAPLQAQRVRHAVRKAAFVTYVTSRFLQERYPPSARAFATAISDVALASSDLDILERRLGCPINQESRVRIGLIGSLKTDYKGVDIAIRAVARLAAEGRNLELRVLGGGDPERFLRLADNLGVEGRVIFEGSLPSGEPVLRWLDEIDIYIQPSLTEGLPRSLIEALSRGCPAVGSDVGGIPELLDAPFLCPPGDPVRLAQALDALIGSPELWEKAVRANLDRAGAHRSDRLHAKKQEFVARLAKAATLASASQRQR